MNLSTGKLLYIWDERQKPTELEHGFYGNATTNYNGHKFTLSGTRYVLPLIYGCKNPMKTYNELRPGEDSINHLGCKGSEIKLMNFISEMFNFTWGMIAPDAITVDKFDNNTGLWVGLFQYVVYGKADLCTRLPTQSDGNRLLYTATILKADDFSIITASPKKKSAIFAIIYPYEAILWPFVIVTTIVMSLVFKLVPALQRKVDAIRGLDPNVEKGISSWFALSALLGENLRDESVVYHRPSVRLVISSVVVKIL